MTQDNSDARGTDLSQEDTAMTMALSAPVQLQLSVNQTPASEMRSEPEALYPIYSRAGTAARMLILRAEEGLLRAVHARTAPARYIAAHMAALRAATAVIAARTEPASGQGPRSVWDVLSTLAPELREWAEFFSITSAKLAALEAGRTTAVTARMADDMLRDAERFYHVVETLLGLPHRPVVPDAIPSCE